MPDPRPLGVFDSGIGGLSVLRAICSQLPNENILYLADQGRVPYGPRPIEEVRRFSEEMTQALLDRGAKAIVVACNTASAAALKHLRAIHPEIPIVGMEPAVKPAAETTQTGVVGVLATPATFQGALYASVVERFAQDVRVLQHAPLGLVEQIEAGEFEAPETLRILREALEPMLAEGIDTIVLGCTHYPFVIPQIEQIAGSGVRVIDPSPAIAAQTARVLAARGLAAPEGLGKRDRPVLRVDEGSDLEGAGGWVRYFTTGDVARMQEQIRVLWGEQAPVVERIA